MVKYRRERIRTRKIYSQDCTKETQCEKESLDHTEYGFTVYGPACGSDLTILNEEDVAFSAPPSQFVDSELDEDTLAQTERNKQWDAKPSR
mmetsp:Transcript_29690/g.78773  ORF Transcript_29690/g.78773 Transcript_29690/m.78773 type:complete len:91 (-) Transcript_29690:380-652(-)